MWINSDGTRQSFPITGARPIIRRSENKNLLTFIGYRFSHWHKR
jgi:hypothetical protein